MRFSLSKPTTGGWDEDEVDYDPNSDVAKNTLENARTGREILSSLTRYLQEMEPDSDEEGGANCGGAVDPAKEAHCALSTSNTASNTGSVNGAMNGLIGGGVVGPNGQAYPQPAPSPSSFFKIPGGREEDVQKIIATLRLQSKLDVDRMDGIRRPSPRNSTPPVTTSPQQQRPVAAAPSTVSFHQPRRPQPHLVNAAAAAADPRSVIPADLWASNDDDDEDSDDDDGNAGAIMERIVMSSHNPFADPQDRPFVSGSPNPIESIHTVVTITDSLHDLEDEDVPLPTTTPALPNPVIATTQSPPVPSPSPATTATTIVVDAGHELLAVRSNDTLSSSASCTSSNLSNSSSLSATSSNTISDSDARPLRSNGAKPAPLRRRRSVPVRDAAATPPNDVVAEDGWRRLDDVGALNTLRVGLVAPKPVRPATASAGIRVPPPRSPPQPNSSTTPRKPAPRKTSAVTANSVSTAATTAANTTGRLRWADERGGTLEVHHDFAEYLDRVDELREEKRRAEMQRRVVEETMGSQGGKGQKKSKGFFGSILPESSTAMYAFG
ncbi:hypothetical protein HK101_007907 [Irineochytrium annulatum]|nr:hypothetical protein HK101_007907 [Irineochytrium annulatum]